MNKIEEIAAMLKQYDIKDLKNVRDLNDLKDFLAHKEEERKKARMCFCASLQLLE